MNWFDNISKEDQNFVKQFLFASGSLKELAQFYEVSYPTVRNRLDKLIEKVRALEQPETEFKKVIRQMVLDDQIDLSAAQTILDAYAEEMEKENE